MAASTTRILRLVQPAAEGQAPEQLYTIAETAGLLRIGRRTVFALLARGELDAVGTHRLTRIPASAIAAYQARNRRSNRSA